MQTQNQSTPPGEPQRGLIKRRIDLIVVHCSATPSGQWLGGKGPQQAGYTTAPAVIDSWHAQRGFKRSPDARHRHNWRLPHIGYHYVIDLDGHLWSGRAVDEVGAHAVGHNTGSIGICLVGGAEREAQYTAAQWAALAELVAWLVAHLPGNAEVPRICGHRDLSPDANRNGQVEPREWLKTCPGFDVKSWLLGGMQAPEGQVCEVPA